MGSLWRMGWTELSEVGSWRPTWADCAHLAGRNCSSLVPGVQPGHSVANGLGGTVRIWFQTASVGTMWPMGWEELPAHCVKDLGKPRKDGILCQRPRKHLLDNFKYLDGKAMGDARIWIKSCQNDTQLETQERWCTWKDHHKTHHCDNLFQDVNPPPPGNAAKCFLSKTIQDGHASATPSDEQNKTQFCIKVFFNNFFLHNKSEQKSC